MNVSSYHDVMVTETQWNLLNPKALDRVTGFILKYSQGEGTKKILPHFLVLNSEDWTKLVCLTNKVAAVMVDIRNDWYKEQDASRKKKEQEEAKK